MYCCRCLLLTAASCARRPFVVSHTGVAALCKGPGERTLSDDAIRAIAAKDVRPFTSPSVARLSECVPQGVIGIGFWEEVTCSRSVQGVAASMQHIARLVGARHVALGSDWDGGVAVPPGLDAAGVAQVTQALVELGFGRAELEGIMGLNALRVLRAALTPSG